jgi:hypothetical protein
MGYLVHLWSCNPIILSLVNKIGWLMHLVGAEGGFVDVASLLNEVAGVAADAGAVAPPAAPGSMR